MRDFQYEKVLVYAAIFLKKFKFIHSWSDISRFIADSHYILGNYTKALPLILRYFQ
jgi:hypothetical protein